MNNEKGNPEFWEKVILNFMHDPPDKAAKIPDHEDRAAQYLAEIFSDMVTRGYLHDSSRIGDIHSASAERLPIPTGIKIEPVNGKLPFFHPLDPDAKTSISVNIDKDAVCEAIRKVCGNIPAGNWRERFFALWRLLPERLAEKIPDIYLYPADTRTPNHTIWHHNDMAAAFAAAKSNTDSGSCSLLMFELGPVQSFIEASRPLRDLWSGSFILSWLVFKAMLPIIEELGPTAIVSPCLRGNPLLDHLLADYRIGVEKPSPRLCATAAFTNVFIALVPSEKAEEFAEKCKKAQDTAWRSLCSHVCDYLDNNHFFDDTCIVTENWDIQIQSVFEVNTTVIPYDGSMQDLKNILQTLFTKDLGPGKVIEDLRKLSDALDAPKYFHENLGRWAANSELLGKVASAHKCVRHVPNYTPHPDKQGNHAHKCYVFGSYEQIGPADFKTASAFWEEQAANFDFRFSSNEHLSAPALVKRFAYDAYFEKLYFNHDGYRPPIERIPDTSTLAASIWLCSAKFDPIAEKSKLREWNGHWLHWSGNFEQFFKRYTKERYSKGKQPSDSDHDKVMRIYERIKEAKVTAEKAGKGKPPTYYGIILMDGDDMGKWLTGKIGPCIIESYHPDARARVQEAANKDKEIMNIAKSFAPLSPARQAAISEALTNFAVRSVPQIVEKHSGFLVYSGGDDVLALLPAESVIKCAIELRKAFSGDENGFCNGKLAMGRLGTLSAGVAVVHHKEHLAFALKTARAAEKIAKISGKNCMALSVVTGSGANTVSINWDFAEILDLYTQAFLNEASDRWAYKLADAADSLLDTKKEDADNNKSGNDRAERINVARSLVLFFVEKMDKDQKVKFAEVFKCDKSNLGEHIEQQFQNFVNASDRAMDMLHGVGKKHRDPYLLLKDFVFAVKSASFLARGRER